MERFAREHPRWRRLLTFFSPSGYEISKHYPGADHVFYLPPDTPARVADFLDIWQPRLAVFVKYEFWFNTLRLLYRRGIPVVFFSSRFRLEQYFFRPWGRWFKKQLALVSCFVVQDEASRQLLHQHGITRVVVGGDTRFDRVIRLRENPAPCPVLAGFASGAALLVAGSTWPADEKLLLPLIRDKSPGLKAIIAPHEVDPVRIAKLAESLGEGTLLYSGLKGDVPPGTRVVIVDRIGLLSQLYRYGQLAYIGGGFGKGIHNILEAATYGLPVFFGPNYHKFAEAVELVEKKAAFCVTDAEGLRRGIETLLADPFLRERTANTARRYVEQNAGATGRVIEVLEGLMPTGS